MAEDADHDGSEIPGTSDWMYPGGTSGDSDQPAWVLWDMMDAVSEWHIDPSAALQDGTPPPALGNAACDTRATQGISSCPAL